MKFYQRMAIVCTSIPYGKVATYGQIALLCGKPKNSRQVGYALRTGRAEGLSDSVPGAATYSSSSEKANFIPAHRIVNSKGILSGAKMFETPDEQKRLLEEEEVIVEQVEDGWRVNLKKYGWHNTMDEAEEFYVMFQMMGI